MTLAKRLLLGSAAALVATTGAQAADLGLPVAPAVDYVQICSVGSFTGFILPGSDVCFDINGFARFQADFNADIDSGDEFDFMGVMELNFDARTMTEYGLLRGFIRIDGTGGNTGDSSVQLQKAFVQFGGLTAGYTDSFFDMVYTDYALGPVGAPTGGSTDMGMIGYAFNVGNGVTLMASLEEGDNRRSARNAGTRDADNSMPDFVAAVRVDQAWGSAKLSGAVFEVDPDDQGAVAYGDEFGFALGASAEFGLPVGVDSSFGIFAIYSSGGLGYAGAAGLGFDYILNGTGGITLVDAIALGAGFEFGLSSNLDLELDGYYAMVDHPGALPDPTAWGVRGSLAYRPVSGLELRAGIGYTDIDYDGLQADVDGAIGGTFRITRSF